MNVSPMITLLAPFLISINAWGKLPYARLCSPAHLHLCFLFDAEQLVNSVYLDLFLNTKTAAYCGWKQQFITVVNKNSNTAVEESEGGMQIQEIMIDNIIVSITAALNYRTQAAWGLRLHVSIPFYMN